MGFVNERLEDGSRQTIDRAKKIILRKTYWAGTEPYARFELQEKNKKLFFEASYRTSRGKEEKTSITHWEVYQINDRKFKKPRSEAISMIKEALEIHGLTGNSIIGEQTIVTFDPRITGE